MLMGTQIGRIEQEFVLKSLIEPNVLLNVHGNRVEVRGRLVYADENSMTIETTDESVQKFKVNEEIRIYFSFKNSYHTFNTKVLSIEDNQLNFTFPPNLYKNLKRKYERIKAPEGIEVYFTLKGTKIELSFPKTERFGRLDDSKVLADIDTDKMKEIVQSYQDQMENIVSENKIVMFRDKLPQSYEERLIVKTGKMFWIPSTQDDLPQKDPLGIDRIIVKNEIIKYEEEQGTSPKIIASKLGNYLYEKLRNEIFSELFCPILYNEYVAGYIYLVNNNQKRQRIQKRIVSYTYQFSKVLCYSLKTDGYFASGVTGDRDYEAPIIDISASGLLFAHPSSELSKNLQQHADLDLTIVIDERKIVIGSRIMRKYKYSDLSYFGVQFLKIEPDDFKFLFEHLYGKQFSLESEDFWEGGAPAPELDFL